MTQQNNDPFDHFAERTATRWFKSAINGIRMKSKIMPLDLYEIDNLRIPPVGELILFEYDAKHKDTLPFWDRFPLIIPIDFSATGFVGYNLHYMPRPIRKNIVKELHRQKARQLSPMTYAKSVHIYLKYLTTAPMMQFCYKNYLAGHVRSKFVCVGENYWNLACRLPLQQFQKENSQHVWKIARGKM